MSGKSKRNRVTPLFETPPTQRGRRPRTMRIPGEFVSLNKLLHSLTNNRRLYFLYRQAAETGSSGARLRFQQLVRSLDHSELREFEHVFKTQRPMQRTA